MLKNRLANLGKVHDHVVMTNKARRLIFAFTIALAICAGLLIQPNLNVGNQTSNILSDQTTLASIALEKLQVKGRAPKTGYSREQFGSDWSEVGGCDMRNLILQRDLTEIKILDDACKVTAGTLHDPYTDKTIIFTRGPNSSQNVQIDHVVALSDAWQKGAQTLDQDQRVNFANDPLNLLAVDGSTNQQKGDGDAATWLPPNKAYRCTYIARQIAVKVKYQFWLTQAERDAMSRVLQTCPDQQLPLVKNAQP